MEIDWNWISSDNVIKKKVISVGNNSRIHPFDNSKCIVRFLDVSVEYGKTFDHHAQIGCPTELVIGEADNVFDRTVERLLQTMVSQEVAQCEMKVGDLTCNIKIELTECHLPSKPLHRSTEEEKLETAQKLKLKASELIKATRYEDAVVLLNRAFRCICWAGGNIEENGFSEIYFSVIANLSLCSLKLNDNEKTVALCSRLLTHRPNHVKCLLRRATALNALQETERAKEDVLSTLAMEPNNKLAEQLLENIRSHMVKQKTEYTALAKKMLHLDK